MRSLPGRVAVSVEARCRSGFDRAGAGVSPLLPSSGAGAGARVARQQSPILPTGVEKLAASALAGQRPIFGPEGEKRFGFGERQLVSPRALYRATTEEEDAEHVEAP